MEERSWRLWCTLRTHRRSEGGQGMDHFLQVLSHTGILVDPLMYGVTSRRQVNSNNLCDNHMSWEHLNREIKGLDPGGDFLREVMCFGWAKDLNERGM